MDKPDEEQFSAKIQGLTNARTKIFEALNRFSDFVNSFSDNSKIYNLQSRLEKVQGLWAEFVGVQGDLEIYDKDSDHSEYRVKFEDLFFECTGMAKAFIDKYFSQNQANTLPTHLPGMVSNNINTNLPKIKLPEFSGVYEQWLQFSDTYKSLIHSTFSLKSSGI